MFLSDPADVSSGPSQEYSKNKASIDRQHRGLVVYNIGGDGALAEGMFYWNGTQWLVVDKSVSIAPAITSLDCSNARISPAVFHKGVPYKGVLIVPYIEGNGGLYSSGDPVLSAGVNGLTATLQAGKLEYGNGQLVYTLSGTPDASSPEPIRFEIDFPGQKCTATITGNVLDIGDFSTGTFVLTKAQVDTYGGGNNEKGDGNLLSNIYPDRMPVIDGLMMDLEILNEKFYRPIIVNTASYNQLVSLQTFATEVNENETILNATLTPAPVPIPESGRGSPITSSGDASSVAAKYMVSVDKNDIVYWTRTAAEVITTNVQVQIDATTYRWYEFKWWAMQIGAKSTDYEKKIFFSVQRKA